MSTNNQRKHDRPTGNNRTSPSAGIPQRVYAVPAALAGEFPCRTKNDPKTVQVRQSDVRTTLQRYAHSVCEDRLAAQGDVLAAIREQGAVGMEARPN